MLIAPIFHNSYLSPKHPESQKKPSDAVSSTSTSTKTSDASNANKYNNMFKSAFNRSITFFSKITSSSGSSTPSTSTSVVSKPDQAGSESHHDSSSSESPSECSSPDSLKTEMIFFKPIIREPKTPSSTKPQLLRIPSIRSTTSSTDRHISSPCPSPFFIPITPRRQSAFSFVGDSKDAESQPIIKPKATKRKNAKLSPAKPAPKRAKQEVSPKSRKSRVAAVAVQKPKAGKTETVNNIRKTRSKEKKDEEEDISQQLVKTSLFLSPKVPVKKSPQKKNQPPPIVSCGAKRVTRSQSLKH